MGRPLDLTRPFSRECIQAFAKAFVACGFRRTEAARRIGFPETQAKQRAYDFFHMPEVIDEIQTVVDANAVKYDATIERIVWELCCIAFLDHADLYDERGKLKSIHDIPERARRAIAGVESYQEFTGFGEEREYCGDTVKVKTLSKGEALKMLGQYHTMFVDKKQVEVTDNRIGQPVIDVPDLNDRVNLLAGCIVNADM